MSKELVKAESVSLAVLGDVDIAEVQSALAENVGVGGLSEFDFDRIKIPSGGHTAFTVSTLDGEEIQKSITGVIVFARDARGYWSKSMEESGGQAPPDCESKDGLTGRGNPGGACATCPLAQFGSAKKGGGQACKATRQLFMLLGDSLLPTVIAMPPTSLKPCKQYMMRLAGAGVPYWAAFTKVSLEKANNSGGVAYAKAKFDFAGKLDAEQKVKAQAYHAMIEPLVTTISAAGDIGGAE